MQRKEVKLCPNCGNPEIEYASLHKEAPQGFVGLGLPAVYFCQRCGYEGELIIETDAATAKKLKFKPVKQTYAPKCAQHLDVLKPVIIYCIILFLISSGFLVVTLNNATASAQNQNSNQGFIVGLRELTQLGSLTDSPIMSIAQLIIGHQLITTNEGQVVLRDLDRSIGINAAGWLLSFLIAVLMIVFLILLIAHHWERGVRFG